MKKNSGFGKLFLGLGIGAGLGALFAPKKGSDTREYLKKKIDEFIDKAKQIDVNDVKNDFLDKADEIKKDLEDLDKEKVLKIAKDKSSDIVKKIDELILVAKDKGTPVLEGIAQDIRNKAISVTKDVLNKLENK